MVSGSAPSTKRPLRAKKSLGQHFLVDRRVRGRIVEAADLAPDDTVVEVGPGRGFLTKALAERAGRVVAVELDGALVESLEDAFRGSENVEIVEGDARTADVDELLGSQCEYKVVANLPYYAASRIVRRFLEARRSPKSLVVMVQREVGLEMTALPGKMGLLSVATQVYGRARLVASVRPSAFRPPPNVVSAVVRIDVREDPSVRFESADRFFGLVKAGFSAPRKQMRNSLRHGLGVCADKATALLHGAGIDPERRAQTLSVEEWGRLYREHVSVGPSGCGRVEDEPH